MTGREKAIVVAAGIAVVWGGVSFLQDAGSPRGRDAGTTGVASAEAFRNQAEAQLLVVNLTPAEHFVLPAAREPWQAGLFRGDGASYASLEDADERIAAQQVYRYSGYAVVGDTRFAVINGRAYRVNETLDNTIAVVYAVEPEYVTLQFTRDGRLQQIPFEGVERERK